MKKAQEAPNHSGKVRIRLYCPEAQEGKEVTLTNEQVRHLKVLHVGPEEPIHVFDGKGQQFLATSSKVSGTYVIKQEVAGTGTYPYVGITIATAVPKGDRMDVLVEKVSELGVGTIIPVIFSRSVVEPRSSKIERLRKIAIEAAAQSDRNMVPTILEPVTFKELLKQTNHYQHAYLCHKAGVPLGQCKKVSPQEKVLIVVGPEGDFTDEEITAARTAGLMLTSLAGTTLRVETAAITAIAQIIGLLEDGFAKARTCPG